jgi:hypothetical protein
VDELSGEVARPERRRFSWPLRCTLYAMAGGVLCAGPAVVAGLQVAAFAAVAGSMLGFAAAIATLRDLHAGAPRHACAVLVHHGGLRYEAGLAWVEADGLRFAGSSRDWSIAWTDIRGIRRRTFGRFVVLHTGGAASFSSLVLWGAWRLRAQIDARRRP